MKLVVEILARRRCQDGYVICPEKVEFDFPVDPESSKSGLLGPLLDLFQAHGITTMPISVKMGSGEWKKRRARFFHVPSSGVYQGEGQFASVIFSGEHISFYPFTDGSGKLWNVHRGQQSRLVDILLQLEQALNAKVTD